MPSLLVHLPTCNRLMCVHNTHTSGADIQWAHLYSLFVWWCFCPNANLYIENKLPDIPAFIQNTAKVVIGTDSYASNQGLSVLEEIKTIKRHFPGIQSEMLIDWATRGGAEYLGIQKNFGTLDIRKKPGINLVEEVNIEKGEITGDSRIRVLI